MEATLYLWCQKAREQGGGPGDGQNPAQWRAADKFALGLEAAPLNDADERRIQAVQCTA